MSERGRDSICFQQPFEGSQGPTAPEPFRDTHEPFRDTQDLTAGPCCELLSTLPFASRVSLGRSFGMPCAPPVQPTHGKCIGTPNTPELTRASRTPWRLGSEHDPRNDPNLSGTARAAVHLARPVRQARPGGIAPAVAQRGSASNVFMDTHSAASPWASPQGEGMCRLTRDRRVPLCGFGMVLRVVLRVLRTPSFSGIRMWGLSCTSTFPWGHHPSVMVGLEPDSHLAVFVQARAAPPCRHARALIRRRTLMLFVHARAYRGEAPWQRERT